MRIEQLSNLGGIDALSAAKATSPGVAPPSLRPPTGAGGPTLSEAAAIDEEARRLAAAGQDPDGARIRQVAASVEQASAISQRVERVLGLHPPPDGPWLPR